MPKLHNATKINASPEKIWQILGDPRATNTWIPGITSVSINGNKRHCTTIDGNEIIEDIDYDDKDHSFGYNQIKVPLPVQSSQGMMAVRNHEYDSLVLWDAELEALDPNREAEVMTMIDGYYKQTLESLRQVVEKQNQTQGR